MEIATKLGLTDEVFCRMVTKTKMLFSNVLGHAGELHYEKILNEKKTKFIKAETDKHFDYLIDKKKIQIRINGQATIEKSYQPSWDKLTNWSRRCYLSEHKPGTEVLKPSSGFPEKFVNESPNDEESIEGLKNFAVIKIIIRSVEWLFLASQGHRRAIFKVLRESSNFSIDKKWLIP